MGPSVVQAAKRLSDAVKAWERNRTTGNEEKMVAARKAFDALMETAWGGVVTTDKGDG